MRLFAFVKKLPLVGSTKDKSLALNYGLDHMCKDLPLNVCGFFVVSILYGDYIFKLLLKMADLFLYPI